MTGASVLIDGGALQQTIRPAATVTTPTPSERSRSSTMRQSLQSGCVNSTTRSPPCAVTSPRSPRSTRSMCRSLIPRRRAEA